MSADELGSGEEDEEYEAFADDDDNTNDGTVDDSMA